MMKKQGWIAAMMALVALTLVSWPARAQDRNEGNEYEGVVPWVSEIDGNEDSLLVRQPDTDWFEATKNTPLGEGDQVWQDKGGRSEIYLDRTTYVRLEEDSGVQFDKLATDEVRMIVTKGSAQVSNGKGGPLYVDLPGQTVVVPPNSKLKVTVNEDGSSEVKVRKGQVTVDGPSGKTRVQAGGRLTADPDGNVDRLERDTKKDKFDKWSDKRDQRLGTFRAPPTNAAASMPEPVAYEMSENGTWINDPEYGWVWSPNVEPDWAPYRAGRWVYRPAWGWTWVSYEPWGWYPYHYGRWVHVHHGWAWAPVAVHHHHWHPGLVFWVEGPDYIAWQPIPYGVSVAVVHTWGPHHMHYVHPHYVTVVSYDHFHHCNYHHYARPWPGHCVSGCYVHSYPHHYNVRGRASVRYRTPRTTGYLSPGRSPRDNVVYANHRGTSARGSTGRVRYGSATTPGRVAGVNDHGRVQRADNRGATDRGRTAPASGRNSANTNRSGSTRPAPGNRENPGQLQRKGGENARPQNNRTGASNRENPGTVDRNGRRADTRPSAGTRDNPGTARPNNNNRGSKNSTADARPAPGNRSNPGNVKPDNYGSQRQQPANSGSRKGGNQGARPGNPGAGNNQQPAGPGPDARPDNGSNRAGAAPGTANPQPRNNKKNKGNRNNNDNSGNNNDNRGNSSSATPPSYTPSSGSSSSSSSSRPSYSSPSSSRPSYSAPSRSSGSRSGGSHSSGRSSGSSRGSRSPR